MLRPASLSDVLSLPYLQARAMPNQARPLRGLGGRPPRVLPLVSLAGEWLPRRRRHAWVFSKRGIAMGVVSVARRGGRSCWEVDCLQVRRRRGGDAIDALESASAAVAGLGAERLLLRLVADGPLDGAAREAGFKPLLHEDLYTTSPAKVSGDPGPENGAQPVAGVDPHDMFRLYLRVTPVECRVAEGVTFDQWMESRDQLPGNRRAETHVVQRSGELAGVLELSKRRGRAFVKILVLRGDVDAAEALLRTAARASRSSPLVACLCPGHHDALALALRGQGFEPAQAYTLFVKRVTVPATRPALVAVGA